MDSLLECPVMVFSRLLSFRYGYKVARKEENMPFQVFELSFIEIK